MKKHSFITCSIEIYKKKRFALFSIVKHNQKHMFYIVSYVNTLKSIGFKLFSIGISTHRETEIADVPDRTVDQHPQGPIQSKL